MSQKISNWIGGIPAPPQQGRYFENRNPATNGILALVPQSDSGDVDAAVRAAQLALPAWRSTSPAERADLLEAVADCIAERLEEFAVLESQDQGKPVGLARRVDIPRAIANFRFFASAVRQFSAESYVMPGALNYTSRKPIGVVGLITPWNLPLYLLSWKTAPALAMGNCIVAKPSELTPLTANALAEVFTEIGAPPGIFNLVQEWERTVVKPLWPTQILKRSLLLGGQQQGAASLQPVRLCSRNLAWSSAERMQVSFSQIAISRRPCPVPFVPVSPIKAKSACAVRGCSLSAPFTIGSKRHLPKKLPL
jgi:aminomuconate-semialdehyde/2-hydroxymuconate-6-semialdehyde dehydrogenase